MKIPHLIPLLFIALFSTAAAQNTSTQPTTLPQSQVTFFNLTITGPNTRHIVYIIDHSGSMLDGFDHVKKETQKSINALTPLQFFNVIMLSETAAPLFPRLQRAGDKEKQEVADQLDRFVAEGSNDDQLAPVQRAFELAFSLKPSTIFFLTDGAFDPRLLDVIKSLNKDQKVHINTLAVRHGTYESQLQNLAKQNNGEYRITPADTH
jgi:hypothetical protein